MEDRYERLFSIQQNLYIEGSAVIIEAGALLKDTATGKIIAQLKFKNITDKVIKAVKVSITSLDTVGRIIGEPTVQQYLDFSAKRDESFGQKTAVMLPDDNTRAFSVSVNEVAFADNSVWSNKSDAKWESLPKQKLLFDDDAEMLKQYQMEINQSAKYELLEAEDLWACACGAINRESEELCHSCHKTFLIMRDVDLKELKAHRDKRLEEERQARREANEKAEKEAEERRIREEREKKRTRKNSIIIAAILAAIIGGGLLTTKVIIPNAKYNTAIEFMNNSEYEKAIEVFRAIGDYKDSTSMLKECKLAQTYQRAEVLLKEHDFVMSKSAFETLGDYRDSKERIKEVEQAQIDYQNDLKYEEALKLFAEGNYDEAEKLFYSLSAFKYKDAEEKLKEVQEARKESNYREAIDKLDNDELIEAYNTFKQLRDYKDSKERVEECLNKMKEYAVSHQYPSDLVTYEYIMCLKETSYSREAYDLYNKLYIWHADIQWKSEEDQLGTKTDARFIITGGPPKGTFKVSYYFYYYSDGRWYCSRYSASTTIMRNGTISAYEETPYYLESSYRRSKLRFEIMIDGVKIASSEYRR